MDHLLELGGLFLVALGAASLLPLQSEPLLVGLLVLGSQPAWLLVVVASLGNTLGSVLNWWLGRQLVRWQGRRWFPVTPRALDRASGWYRRWGHWSLLLSWAPVIGDPLTLAAGVLREPFWRFLALVALAKTGRYAVLALITLNLL
ncbi:YqaA family protein [Falsiroseomonas selenitidurans]|uniref:DedA family protein n=1 Tax=Falsiroseomonas selenitidurans TaxID=2716335 RepID=A0ABX1E9R6_9PROT|nr:YqaA family protein [Falsiroseomonas selenitidurans]NKC33964.1 DedA family protein [Falsiroseomonas selenitidurans]